MIRKSRRGWKKTLFAALVLFVFSLVLFRDSLFQWGVRGALALSFPEVKAAFKKSSIEGSSLHLKEVSLSAAEWRLEAPEVKLKIRCALSPFSLRLSLKMKDVLLEGKGEDLLSICSRFSSLLARIHSVRWEGVLSFGDEKWQFFFRNQKEKGGEARISSDPEERCPLFVASWKESEYTARVQGAPLASLAGFLPDWEVRGGTVEFSGEGEMDSSFIPLTLKGEGRVQNLIVGKPKESMDFFFQKGEFSVTLPNSLQELSLKASLSEGKVVLQNPFGQGDWELARVEAAVSKSPREPLVGTVQGVLLREGSSLACMGVLRADDWRARALEIEMDFEKKAAAHLKLICSDEGGLHAVFRECDREIVEVGQEIFGQRFPALLEWEVSEGLFNGELFSSEKGIEMRKCSFLDLKLQNLHKGWLGGVKRCEGSARFSQEGELDHCRFLFEDADADLISETGEMWNLSHLQGSLSAEVGRMFACDAKGSFAGLEGRLVAEGPSLFDKTRFCLQGGIDQVASLFSQELAEAYQESEELPLQIEGEILGAYPSCKIIAHLRMQETPGPPLHVEADLLKTRIERLRFASQQLAPSLYAPLLALLFPSLEWGGKLSLQGSYAYPDLHCSVTVKDAFLKHSAFPFTLLSSQKTATWLLEGNLVKKQWHLSLPLFCGTVKSDLPLTLSYETSLDIYQVKDAPWMMRAHLSKGEFSFGDLLKAHELVCDLCFDGKSQTLTCRHLGAVSMNEKRELCTISSERFELFKRKERWAYGTFLVKDKERESFWGTLEALCTPSDLSSFMLIFQEKESPSFFLQGKRKEGRWEILRLPVR